MKTNKPTGLESAESEAGKILKSRSGTRRLADRAEHKAKRNRTKLGEIWAKLTGFIRMSRAWSNGEYKKVSLKTMILVVAAVFYFLNPFDIIPDFIPFLGFLDDISIISFVGAAISKDIEKFLDWEAQKKRSI